MQSTSAWHTGSLAHRQAPDHHRSLVGIAPLPYSLIQVIWTTQHHMADRGGGGVTESRESTECPRTTVCEIVADPLHQGGASTQTYFYAFYDALLQARRGSVVVQRGHH